MKIQLSLKLCYSRTLSLDITQRRWWTIGGMILTAETDVLGEIKLSRLHFVYYKSPTLTCLVLNPHLCSDRPATNLLSQGVARQFAEKLAVDRSQVQGNDLVGEIWKRRANYETWNSRADFLFGRSRVRTNLDQKAGYREIFSDFQADAGTAPQIRELPLCSPSFLPRYGLTSTSCGAM